MLNNLIFFSSRLVHKCREVVIHTLDASSPFISNFGGDMRAHFCGRTHGARICEGGGEDE